jgi:hypothetical protein
MELVSATEKLKTLYTVKFGLFEIQGTEKKSIFFNYEEHL